MSEDDFFIPDDDEDALVKDNRPSLAIILISLLVLLALLATMILPILQSNPWRMPQPTPTPSFLKEA